MDNLIIKTPERLLKLPEVATKLGISKTAAYRLAQSGELPAIRFGKSTVRVLPADLESFIKQHRTLDGGGNGGS